MKKLTCIVLLLSIVLSLSACNTEEKVSIYIPDTVTEYIGESKTPTSVSYLLYPNGWETAENFVVSYSADGKIPTANGTTITHTANHSMKVSAESSVDEYFDEKGQVVSRNILHGQTLQLYLNVFTYDEHGRILSRITSTSVAGGAETYLPQVTFQYQPTEQGSKGVGEQKGYTETYCYDKQYRMVSYTEAIFDVEARRTEYVYDANGNLTEELVYVDGKLESKSVTTYKVVEVDQATADRLLQFKRVN